MCDRNISCEAAGSVSATSFVIFKISLNYGSTIRLRTNELSRV